MNDSKNRISKALFYIGIFLVSIGCLTGFVFFQAPGNILLICAIAGLFIGLFLIGMSEVISLLSKQNQILQKQTEFYHYSKNVDQ
ncbi:hypothetical protein [Pontibacillus yanchengensis]|uniref:Uncharacterized protein n=1 Tax=Pontibacillus yanchengensis Y32 TaxID=1385514 RepID=A0A0A2TUG9_9BACI|nr:hypothetical protein [Pontibacillus yanchengensis]KGP72915.1 hypothetical protein N782_09835 [Pontibacillus yanchengensis Y32]